MVKLYSKPGCGQCIATERAFKKEGVDYEYVDVYQDEEAFKFVTQTLGYQGVPVVVTEDDHWNGYKPEKIKAL